ncbi:MAG: nucleoside-binding protein, partial [Actinomycetia bacterium]|nr:nucleoside-binding protein [Actinomycetes bacterium]
MRHTSLITVVAGTAAALLLAACGSSSSGTGSTSSSASGTPSSSSSSSPASGSSFLACMVTDTGGINDKSFNQSAWEGMQEAASANSNVTTRNIQSIPPNTDYTRNINTFIGEKCGIIVTVGFAMGDATQAASKANPTQDFAIVDNAYDPVIKNVDSLVYNTVQDGFLGGYLAAGMT